VEEEGEGGVEGIRGWVREGEREAVRWAYGRGCEIWLVVEVVYTYKFTQVVFLFSFTSDKYAVFALATCGFGLAIDFIQQFHSPRFDYRSLEVFRFFYFHFQGGAVVVFDFWSLVLLLFSEFSLEEKER
jgi:hypothetical protein